MVRISDLVRGKPLTPAEAGEGDTHTLRMRNIKELIQMDSAPRDRPEESPPAPAAEQAPERRAAAQSVDFPAPPERAVAPATAPPGEPHAGRLSGAQEEPPAEPPVRPTLPEDAGQSAPNGKELYQEAQTYLQEVRDRLLRSKGLNGLERPLRFLGPLIEKPSVIDEMYPLTMIFGHGYDLNIAHSVNNMIYCCKMGRRMGYPPETLTALALAALHHDIGMFLVPEAILRKETPLGASELAAIRKHTRTGRDLLQRYDAAYPNLSRAVYEHHERESGQGYPDGLKGGEICEFAKIIGICDSYEAMTHDRPHKKAMEQYISVLEIVETKALFFAPSIVKVFLDEITLYPIGSRVRLNNGAIGIVTSPNRNNPFKPTVRIVVDGHGNPVQEAKFLDLAETNILHIVTGVKADEAPA